MLTSSTLTFSMGSGERKRCSNMAQFRLDESAEVARGAVLNAENGMQVIVVLDDHAGTELCCLNRHCWFTSPYSLLGILGQRGRSPGLPPHIDQTVIKQLFYTARSGCGNGVPIRPILYPLLPRTAETDFLRAGGVVITDIDRSGCGSGFVWRELDLDRAAFRRPERRRAVVGGHNEIVGG